MKLLLPPHQIDFKFTSFVMTEGNCKKCAYNAAVMASATGSVGGTEEHRELLHSPYPEPYKVTKWAKVVRVRPAITVLL